MVLELFAIDGGPGADHASLIGEKSFGLVSLGDFYVLHGGGSLRD
jgi:hypothetical protein